MDHQRIWTETQERVSTLATSLTAEHAAATVPACPDWQVKDLLAHMTGVDADAWNGDVDEDFSDSWTDAHVRQRVDASLVEVLDEWNALRSKAALDMFAECFDQRVRENGLPTLHVDAGEWQRTFGDGEPEARVSVEEFEFQRALTGRRSTSQVRAWVWSDPQVAERYVPVLSGFGALRDDDLVE